MNELTPNDVQQVAKQLKEMADAPFVWEPYVIFANKSAFYAIQDKRYFVIGTRLITNPIFLNKNKDKQMFYDSFFEADITHAQFFKSRNAAKQAVARNRRGIEYEEVTNETTVMIRGIKYVLNEPAQFQTEIILGEEK